MMGKTHKSFATAIALPLMNYIGYFNFSLSNGLMILTGLILVRVGAILPDIDHPKSTIGRFFPTTSAYIKKTFGHRSITHSFIGIIIVTVLLYTPLMYLGVSTQYGYWVVLGYISHLISDSLTPTGVKWFYPSKEKTALGWITTGSKKEEVFALFTGLVTLWQVLEYIQGVL